jgi:hypothetical protein
LQNANAANASRIHFWDRIKGPLLVWGGRLPEPSLYGELEKTLFCDVGDYYIAPRFLERVAVHIAKNFLVDAGSLDPHVRVPLILGIWGGKGQGKTFQTELCFRKLG